MAAKPSGLGDELSVTPVIREARRVYPRERITLQGFYRTELFLHNPHLPGGTEEAVNAAPLENGGAYVDIGSIPKKYAAQLGLHPLDDTPEIFLTDREKNNGWNVSGWAKTVAIDTWSNNESRRWPLRRYQKVADRLKSAGWTVFEVGSHKGDRLTGVRGSLRNVLTIRQTASFVRRVSVYLGNDSGLFHLAASVGTPQVVLFSIVPGRLRAYWNTLALGSTSRCYKCTDVCKLPADGPACLAKIETDQVVEAVQLAGRRFPR